MAKYYNCDKEIGCFVYLGGVFKQCKRNRIGKRALPVFNCPHCDSECQETALTAILAAFLIFGILFAFIKTINYLNIDLEQGRNSLLLIPGVYQGGILKLSN